jgi:hypothetical protein
LAHYLPVIGGAIALELIRDDHTGGVLAPLQELAEECLRGPLVTARLDKEIQHMPVLIHRTPEGMPLASDGEAHVVQVPRVARLG